MGCETRKKINIRKLMSELEKKLVQLNSTFARRVNKGGEERGGGGERQKLSGLKVTRRTTVLLIKSILLAVYDIITSELQRYARVVTEELV